MLYPIAIENPSDNNQAYGVTVPDIQGCFSAGDTLDDAILSAKEAIELHLESMAHDGEEIPSANDVQYHKRNPEFNGFIWALVDIDTSKYLRKPHQ